MPAARPWYRTFPRRANGGPKGLLLRRCGTGFFSFSRLICAANGRKQRRRDGRFFCRVPAAPQSKNGRRKAKTGLRAACFFAAYPAGREVGPLSFALRRQKRRLCGALGHFSHSPRLARAASGRKQRRRDGRVLPRPSRAAIKNSRRKANAGLRAACFLPRIPPGGKLACSLLPSGGKKGASAAL